MDGTGLLICAAKFLFLNLSRVWVLSCFLRVLCISAEKAFWGAPRSSKERANCDGQNLSLLTGFRETNFRIETPSPDVLATSR